MSARNTLAAKATRRHAREARHAGAPRPFGRFADCRHCGKYRVTFTAPVCMPCAAELAESLAALFGWRPKATIR